MGTDDNIDPAEVITPEDSTEEHSGEAASEGFDRWRKESPIGGIGTGIARGLHAVFAPPADEVVIMAAVPGEPPDADQRMRVILDPDDPTKSVAIMPEGTADPESDKTPGGTGDS